MTHKQRWKRSSTSDCARQRLIDVLDEIIDVLESDGETDRFWSNARCKQLCFAQLAMRGRSGVNYEGLCVAQVKQPLKDLHRVEEVQPCLIPAGNAECDDR